MKKKWTPKLSAPQYNRITEGEWFEFVDFSYAKKAHAKNIDECTKATKEYSEWPRNLRILAVHGSGRSSNATCAYEVSNSKVFLDTCLKNVLKNHPGIELDIVNLREYNISPCNNCVSTSSAHCGFPCFLEPETEVLQPKGWVAINKIKEAKNEKVLSHKGKFRKYLGLRQTLPNNTFSGDGYRIFYKILDKEYQVFVTPDHKFLSNFNFWIRADHLEINQKILWTGKICSECGCKFSIFEQKNHNNFCSKKCEEIFKGKSNLFCSTEYKNFECVITNIEIEKVIDKPIYCVVGVEKDSSFITRGGLISHNCNCFPLDPMQKLYPKVLRSDILLCSTGVNQSAMSTRLKAFCDRLISVDGGFFVDKEQFTYKNAEWREKTMALAATTDIAYDQRMYGRVGAYFVSSKDENNPHPVLNHLKTKFDQFNYIEMTAQVLRDGFEAYGFFHDTDFYAGAASNPDIDYMYDKETLSLNTNALKYGEHVIEKAIKLSLDLKKNLPKFKTDRYNRT